MRLSTFFPSDFSKQGESGSILLNLKGIVEQYHQVSTLIFFRSGQGRILDIFTEMRENQSTYPFKEMTINLKV